MYTEKELQSRFVILSEAYVKTLIIEANTALMMAKNMILPAALRYQKEVADSVASLKAAGVNGASSDLLNTLVSTIGEFTAAIRNLEHAQGHAGDGEPYAHAKHMRNDVFPALNDLRKSADKLETIVADDLWPLPTYREMLFIK